MYVKAGIKEVVLVEAILAPKYMLSTSDRDNRNNGLRASQELVGSYTLLVWDCGRNNFFEKKKSWGSPAYTREPKKLFHHAELHS